MKYQITFELPVRNQETGITFYLYYTAYDYPIIPLPKRKYTQARSIVELPGGIEANVSDFYVERWVTEGSLRDIGLKLENIAIPGVRGAFTKCSSNAKGLLTPNTETANNLLPWLEHYGWETKPRKSGLFLLPAV